MFRLLASLVMVVAVSFAPKVFAADAYKVDAVHSSIGFSVKHMMVSNTTGQFDQYDGAIAYDANDLANSKIDITIQASSINTRNTGRDGHLQGADFFDVAQFPTITFVSKSITADAIVGDLTIKGVTKEVTVPASISGPVTGMGKTKIGISAQFTLNRQDYGVSWNKTLDQGGVAVGDEVKVTVDIEADKQEAAAPEAAK